MKLSAIVRNLFITCCCLLGPEYCFAGEFGPGAGHLFGGLFLIIVNLALGLGMGFAKSGKSVGVNLGLVAVSLPILFLSVHEKLPIVFYIYSGCQIFVYFRNYLHEDDVTNQPAAAAGAPSDGRSINLSAILWGVAFIFSGLLYFGVWYLARIGPLVHMIPLLSLIFLYGNKSVGRMSTIRKPLRISVGCYSIASVVVYALILMSSVKVKELKDLHGIIFLLSFPVALIGFLFSKNAAKR